MRLRAVGALLLSMAVAGTACTSEEESAPAPEEPSDPPSPEDAAEQSALEAYEGMWEIVVEASHEGDPDPDALEAYASGEALDLTQHMLAGAVEDGVEVEGEPEFAPEVVEVSPEGDPDTVTILDCVDDSEWVEHGGGSDGEPESGDRQVDATVSDDSLSWKVEDLRLWERGSC